MAACDDSEKQAFNVGLTGAHGASVRPCRRTCYAVSTAIRYLAELREARVLRQRLSSDLFKRLLGGIG